MTFTKIHTTKKLEKLIKKYITTEEETEQGYLGRWKATVFYVRRIKCWLLTNALTKYNVILTDIKACEMNKIEQTFKDAFYAQLIFDGILIDFDDLNAIIGSLVFLPTDNDRRTTGFQNTNLDALKWWKAEFGDLKNMPIKDLANRLNTTPIHIGESKRMGDFTCARDEMKNVLTRVGS